MSDITASGLDGAISTISYLTCAIGLHTADGEIIGAGNYRRETIDWSTPVNHSVLNATEIVFSIAGSDWGIITHICGYNNIEAGLGTCSFTAPIDPVHIRHNDQMAIPPGSLKISAL